MKNLAPALALLALLALAPSALFAAGTPAAATAPTAAAAATPAAPLSVDEFFAALSSHSSPAPRAAAASDVAVSTICHSTADCPAGWLCCYPCGIPDCNFVCKNVKRCPLIP